ncbi:unnamed protein product [Caenorhabditis bovis]|uniref:HECT domain-containing protein n=1 Tax=Caenorhabditis bovis TaxID=2654633 RepID=A0A8S1FE57_9PELO|nr:unnamed protein product [Caenorhabditis bovis]
MDPPKVIMIGRERKSAIDYVNEIARFLEIFAYLGYSKVVEDIVYERIKFGSRFYQASRLVIVLDHDYVEENVGIARRYLLAKRLFAFELCWVTPDERQLIGFRICVKTLTRPPEKQVVHNRDLVERLNQILEKFEALGIPDAARVEMTSTKIRPRIRLLACLRSGSEKTDDTSTSDNHKMIPIADSIIVTTAVGISRYMILHCFSLDFPNILIFFEMTLIYYGLLDTTDRRISEYFPTAWSFVCMLKLPKYSTREKLDEKLRYAINSNAGFELM